MAKEYVAIDIGGIDRRSEAPGTAKMVLEQSRALLKMDVPWRWLVVAGDSDSPLLGELSGHEIVQLRGKYSLRTTFRLGGVLNRYRCKACFAPGAVVPITRIPVLATYFDTNIFEHGGTWIRSGEPLTFLKLQLLARHLFRRSKVIFINSQYCASQLICHFPALRKRIVVNHPGVEPLVAPPRDTPAWASASILRKGFVLFAGAFSENKNQPRLVRAWKELQENHDDLPALVLIGPSTEEYFKMAIEPIIGSLKRPEEVVVPGHVPEAELSWAFHNTKAYIQPSIAEGCSSFSVFQAMTCGIPVACANTTSHPEAVGNAAVLFDPFDIQAIKHAAKRVIYEESTRRELASLGRERIQAFRWERNAGTVCEHIGRIIGSIADTSPLQTINTPQ